MSIYNKYPIHQGDTLQKIAFYKLGDMSKWTDIRDINNLEYPYIVNTPEEKLTNINHLLSVGDYIYLPEYQRDVNKETINNLQVNSYDKEQMYDTVLGRDLAVSVDFNCLSNDSNAILYSDNNIDLATKVGSDNVYQSLIMRIFTRKGALLLHPNYGGNFVDYIGKPLTPTNIKLAESELSRIITTDSRVSDCTVNSEQLSSNSVSFVADIKLKDENKLISLYISIMDDGKVIVS